MSYQLRDNVTNNTIGGPIVGTGSTLSLPTGALTSNSTFNVFATIGSCSNQLTTVVSVSVLPSGDPLCAPLNNCATVIITPATTLATCGAAVPDGTVTFDIVPAVPLVNLIGVKIEIDGPFQATQFNNFIFTGLPVGIYDYTVTYGDDTNPACIKTGLFTIDPTGIPDLVDFDIASSTYDCLISSGSVVLTGLIGSANTDYTFMIFDNGSIVQDGAITKDQAASGAFTISDLALGSYQLQLSQNQSGVNGCVGSVTSAFYDLDMVEPTGGCGLFVPNVFTPNGDGANDLLVIRNLPTNSQLIITNRWGKEVFNASDYKNDWTGGEIADGIYYYTLSADGQAYKGWIEILRGQ
ncbi:MAG: gliding motility-associated C-terminal domain-containing protein [Cytophagales bacterium]|nr:gliding motility-associated C-terminal domain-containing protein [Cytophagales bacterium]